MLVLVALAAAGCADFERGSPAMRDSTNATQDGSVRAEDAGVTVDVSIERVSYTGQVYPLLLSLCRDCHRMGGEATTSGFVLGGDSLADYPTIARLSSSTRPAESRLLAKATGQGHQGGVVISAGADAFEIIVQWVQQGLRP
ncbi:MAG: hypothetical protein SGI86_13430 [Deltaproteobacteria bacterium]|nr:hypothetical protein [Deltaproteobacteria bacterium]